MALFSIDCKLRIDTGFEKVIAGCQVDHLYLGLCINVDQLPTTGSYRSLNIISRVIKVQLKSIVKLRRFQRPSRAYSPGQYYLYNILSVSASRDSIQYSRE